jgi:hypothetical protein
VVWKPDYLTLAEAKAYLRTADTIDDVEIAGWITAASRAIDYRCNRQFGQLAAPAARVYRRTPVWSPDLCLWTIDVDDVQDLTGLTVNGVAYASQRGVMLPDNAPADSRPWTQIGFADQPTPSTYAAPVALTVVARWGWTAVPAQVPAACKLQLSRWMSRRDSPNGIAGSPESGQLRLLARLDPDVATTLGGLGRRRRVG